VFVWVPQKSVFVESENQTNTFTLVVKEAYYEVFSGWLNVVRLPHRLLLVLMHAAGSTASHTLMNIS